MDHPLRSIAPATAIVVLVAVVDLALGPGVSLVPLLVVGPLLAAALAAPREAAGVGAFAVVVAVAVAVSNHALSHTRFLVGVSTVLVGAVLGPVVAAARAHERAARRMAERSGARTDLAVRAGRLFDSGADPLEHLDELAALPVPALADLCVVDLFDLGGALRTATVASERPDKAIALREMRRAHPVRPDSDHPVALVARSGRPVLLRDIEEPDLQAWGYDDDHRDRMRRLGYHSAIVVPLTARGRTIGTVALHKLEGSDPYDDEDLDAAADFARRAGLAIDHARLGAALGATEAELRTVLGGLAEAVTVRRPDGSLVYANQAAAELEGYGSVGEMLEAPVDDFLRRWVVRDEHGDEVERERLPAVRALGGEDPAVLLLALTDRTTGERRWRLTKSTPVLGRDGRPRLAVNVIEDVTEQRRRELGQTFLAHVSKVLTAPLDPAETLEQVAAAVVPKLADWCTIDMPDERGRLRRVATADRAPERRRRSSLLIRERPGRPLRVGPPQVMRTGESEFHPQISDELLRAAALDDAQLEQLRAVGARSVLCVPMVGASDVIGAITMGTVETGRRLSRDDLALAEELGRRTGLAVEHAREHRERSAIAGTLQEALLPPRLPVIADLTIAARFRAAGGGDTVGGDFYDLFPIESDPGAWMLIIGDVTGKGPAAAAITSLARYAMRTAALYERDPSRVLRRLNQVLSHDEQPRRLCTAVCARVEPAPGRATVTVARAGHPPPLLISEDGHVSGVGEPGTLLGAFEHGHWTDTTVHLGPAATLVLYTDGVTDTRGPEGRFGHDRLERIVGSAAGHDPDHVAAALDEALLAFQEGSQRDDVALLVLQPAPVGGETSVVGDGAGYTPARSSDIVR
jgi:serine phosphatase RsbU (regulator of sigma subunit)/PAS domain-containing protein